MQKETLMVTPVAWLSLPQSYSQLGGLPGQANWQESEAGREGCINPLEPGPPDPALCFPGKVSLRSKVYKRRSVALKSRFGVLT